MHKGVFITLSNLPLKLFRMNLLRKVAPIIVLFFYSHFLMAQNLILNDLGNIRYFLGKSEPDSNWNQPDFNDNSWLVGHGCIGYGDPVDTVIPPVTSLYTRSWFNLDNLDNYNEIIVQMDFDDGFVAYVNGVELARVNMGKMGTKTTWNQLADRSHEMEFYRDKIHSVPGYYMGKDFINKYLKQGQNILAIEVHNDSINGSDLGVYGAVYDFTGQPYNIFNLDSRYKRCVQLDSTALPLIVIETNEYGVPFKRIEVPAWMGIINNGPGKYNKPGDAYNEYNSLIKIEQRGESSATYPKKSFDIELKDNDYNDTSISILGMPREADWVLQGPFADRSQLRNAIAYELGRKTGHWAPRLKFCEVIFNGEYLGLYNMIEKIKRDSSRVNIGKLRPEEISGTDLTGGYIIKYDKPNNAVIQIVYPTNKNLRPEQKEYIENFINQYESVLYSNDGLDPQIGYQRYINQQSLIDYMVVSELTRNCDAYYFSSYLYKDKDDRDGRLNFGPLWDFDLSIGNSIWQDGSKIEGWEYEYPSNSKFDIKRLFEDPEMVRLFQDRWHDLRQKFLDTDSLFTRIDEMVAELKEPLKRNYEVWPVIDKGLYFPYYTVPNYDEEILYMKNWLTDRIAWIDNNINDIHYDVTHFDGINDKATADRFSSKVYPNPFHTDFYIDLNMPVSGTLEVELINIQGKVVSIIENAPVKQGEYKIYWNKGTTELYPGLYLVSISIDGRLYQHEKLLYN